MGETISEGGDSGAAAAAIAAGSATLNNLLNIAAAHGSDRASRKWQETMWNKQNEYNLPVNQVARLKDAGINPNLAFGSSASALGTTVPSSPATHVPHLSNPMDSYVAAKQAMANVRKQNEETRREKLNNDLTELLFTDMFRTRQASLGAEYLGSKWFWEHGYDKMDTELAGIELQNDLRRAEMAYTRAKTSLTYQNLITAKRELEHLKAKYKFEDSYYLNYLNPYETSTPLGLVRTITGASAQAIDWIEWMIKTKFGKNPDRWRRPDQP